MDGDIIFERLAGRQRVLLLQGPGGSFFRRLAVFLRDAGCEVTKVNFNAGDALFYRLDNALAYRGKLENWQAWLEDLLRERRIEALVLFGDCRHYHRLAIAKARALGVDVLVFEEGYLRPGFVTFEAGGVNANSTIPALFNETRPDKTPLLPAKSEPVRMPPFNEVDRIADFTAMGLQAAAYAIATKVGRHRFPDYRHHKSVRLIHELHCWLRSGWRKTVYRLENEPRRYLLTRSISKQFFVAPLQVFNDSQLTHHSSFRDQNDFIETLMRSFSKHAAVTVHLVFKHHPMDRGHRHYGAHIRRLSRELGLQGRVHYIHDMRLPVLFRHTRGVLTVNSTAGLSALYHGAPVICLGRSLYDLPGLTHQGGLDKFWRSPQAPQASEVLRLRAMLRDRALVPGSFYRGPVARAELAGAQPAESGQQVAAQS